MYHSLKPNISKADNDRSIEALKIVGIYVVVGGLWILLSDEIVAVFIAEPTVYRAAQTYKGWFYVVFTGLLLYALIKRTLVATLHSQDALIESENRYRMLVEQIPAIAYIAAPDSSNTIYVSPQAEQMLGFSAGEWHSNPKLWARQLHPEDRERVLHASSASKRAGNPPFHLEYRMLAKDGRTLWVQDAASKVSDDAGKVLYTQGVMISITERKEAEESLDKERDFIAAIMDTAGSLVVVFDAEARILRFNYACERISGYKYTEIMGKHTWDFLLIPKEVESTKAEFRKLQAGQLLNEHTNHWRTRNGDLRLIAWASTGILDDHGNVEYIIGTGIDITEKQKAEESAKQ